MDISNLTNDQERVLQNCSTFFAEKPSSRIKLISGFAGCGKTWLIAHMCRTGIITGKAVMSAPTHKAVRVLNRSMKDVKADFATIQSLLMVRPSTDEDGNKTFMSYARAGMKLPIHNYDTIVLDEVSMMEDELFRILIDYKASHTRLLLSGDSFQLEPVDHDPGVKSIPFREPDTYHIETETLSEIVRQKNGNSIIPFASQIRGHKFPMVEDYGSNIRQLSRQEMGRNAVKLFKSDEYRDNRDRFRYLAYTNASVDRFNASVHSILQPPSPENDPVAVGEVIILRSPYTVSNDLILQNNDELTIEGKEIDSYHLHYDWDKIQMDAVVPINRCYVTNDIGQEAEVNIAVNQVQWTNLMDKLHNKIKYTKMTDKRTAWRLYWDLMGSMATWKHSYAQTIHTAQGSTFYETAIDTRDVRICKNISYWNLMYTGVTRSSDILTLV